MLDVFFGPDENLLHGILLTSDKPGAPAAVICHPHPQFGGSMNNNVVLGVETALSDAGITTLRFNFRGVGLSKGRFDNGVGEKEDVLSTVNFLAADKSIGSIHFVGYSFGALVGMDAVMNDERVRTITGIAPPTVLGSFSFLAGCRKPTLAIAGSRDEYCDIEELKRDIEKCGGSLQVVPGADHFFMNIEDKIADMAKEFILKNS